ncbi:MAG TPA: NifB/NifX family molybdenum-iron cluster-binding protein [Anaerolineales bacterium]
MKIAVVTDDNRTISAHFGRALYYEVFTVSDGKITGHESLPKPAHTQFPGGHPDEPGYAHGRGPAAESTHARMLEPIRDCQVLLAGGMGQGAFNSLKQAGIQPVLTDIHEIELAVKAYMDGHLVDHPEWLH